MASDNNTLHGLVRLSGHLSAKRRLQLLGVMVLILMGALAELVTIGAIVPFLALMTNPKLVAENPKISWVMDVFGWTDPHQLLMPIAGLFGFVAIASGVIRIALAYVNNKFAHRIGHDLGIKIYSKTLYMPYSEHALQNSSTSLSGIQKVTSVVTNVIKPLMIGASSLVIAVSIVGAMMAVNLTIALSAALGFGGIYLLVTLVTRKRLKSNSTKIAKSQTQRFQTIQEGLGGIRDVILDQAQPVYIAKFNRIDTILKDAQATNAFIGAAPRYIIESVGMSLIVLMAIVLNGTQGGLLQAIPVLGALALGAQRLMPLLQQVFLSWSQALGGHREVTDVLALLDRPVKIDQGPPPKRMAFKRDITLDSLSFRYTPDADLVLRNVDLHIPKGKRVGFIGKTGSGKSTAIDLIMGLLDPSAGAIKIDGVAIDAANRASWQMNISHVPQSIFLVDDSIAANIAFGKEAKNIDMDAVRDAARKAELADYVEALPEGYETRVGERGVRLSGGQRQRIGIARALYKGADVLVLDEATSALDSATETAVMASINSLSRDLTMLVVAHRLSTLASCDMIVELQAGRIVRVGSFEEIVEGDLPPEVGQDAEPAVVTAG